MGDADMLTLLSATSQMPCRSHEGVYVVCMQVSTLPLLSINTGIPVSQIKCV